VYIYDLYIYIYKFPEPWKPVSKETRLRAGRLVSNSFQVIWCDFLFSPPCSDRLWGPASLLSNGYRGLLPRG